MDTVNPYAPTVHDVSINPNSNMQLASQNKRFLNLIIDNIAMWVINSGIGFGIGVLLGFNGGINPDQVVAFNIISYIIGTLSGLTYFALFEQLTGRTLGKLITGTKVVNEDGGTPTFGQILGRSACRFIPFEPFSFLFGTDVKFPAGWHDRFSKTRVVSATL